MALKRDSKTLRYIIKNEDDLIEALELYDEFIEGLAEDIRDSNMLREAATHFMDAKGMKEVTLGSGKIRKLTRRFTRKWIGTKADLKGLDASPNIKPLKDIVEGQNYRRHGKAIPMWQAITKRIPDPDKIDELVAEGVLDEDEIAPAFVEIPQKPFIQM